MNYTLHQLHIFLKVTQTLSLTKAAEELHLTQPAVSIQLKNLQKQFDLPLTEVVGRKIYITDFGKDIALAAEKILDQAKAMHYSGMALKGQLIGKIKISVVSTGKYVMPYFLSDFIHQHPGVEINMDVTNKSKVLDSLENNEVNFALVSILPATLAVEQLDLMENKLYLVGPGISGPIKKASHSIFEKVNVIFREKGSGTRQTMEKFFREQGISIIKNMELTSNEAVKQAVIAGLGHSVMPLIGIKNELQNHQLSIIPIKGLPIQTTWSLIWLKGKKHNPVCRAYLSYLQEEKNSIIQDKFSWYSAY